MHRPLLTFGTTIALCVPALVAQPVAADPAELSGRLVLTHTTFGPGAPEGRDLVSTTPAGGDRQVLVELGAGAQFDWMEYIDWTSDHERMVFAGSEPGQPYDVWTARGDGSDPVQLTSTPGYEEAPTWSPDGSRIAFLRRVDDQNQVWLMDADGSDPHQLLEWPAGLPSPQGLDWEPGGDTLVTTAGLGVYTLEVSDPEPTLLFTSPGSAIDAPNWSPDGEQLSVTVEITGLNYDVFLLDPDDGSAVNLTDTPDRAEFSEEWSPDGTALVWGGWHGAFEHDGVWVHELADGVTTQVLPIDPNVESYSVAGWIPEPASDPDAVDTEVQPGQTVGTDPEGDGATPEDPVETSVTSPNAGTVTVEEGPVTATPPEGYEFFGQEVQITAPTATATEPIVLVFRLDASLLPPGLAATDAVAFRNGAVVAACTGSPGQAAPDPCTAAAVLEPDGDLSMTVLTSAASRWHLGVGTAPPPDTTPPTIAISAPRQDASYGRDQAVVVRFGCTDGESGVEQCSGTRPDGSLLDTTRTGSAAFRVDASDVAGNTTSRAVTYRVVARRAVTPVVTCVSRGSGGWWTARLGYRNPNAFAVNLPTGARNGFTSAPVDRGQPTYLVAGTVASAVQVQFRSTVSWRLDGTTVTARITSRRC